MESKNKAQQAVMDEVTRLESEMHKILAAKEKNCYEWAFDLFHLFYEFHLDQLIPLAKLRFAFNLKKKLPICGGYKDHLDFELSVIHYLQKVSPKTTNDEICVWIETEYAKLAPRGVGLLHNFAFIRSLFAAIIHCSLWSSPLLHAEILNLNKEDFRRWAPILHHFTSDHSVAASQILLFVVQDYAAPVKYPKCVLGETLEVLSENEKFLSYIDTDGVFNSKERLPSIVRNCLLLIAEQFPESCA